MTGFDYISVVKLALPELVVSLTLLLVLVADLTIMRGAGLRDRRYLGAGLVTAGCLVAVVLLGTGEGVVRLGAMLVTDPATRLVQVAMLVLTIGAAWVSVEDESCRFVGEYFALLLVAAVGMLLLVATEHLLMIFLSLEMVSLALYVLVGIRKESMRSAEAALKFFLFGSVASAFALFGLSLVYGATGSLELRGIAAATAGQSLGGLLAVALVMVMMGFGFKVAAVPFHLWAPDTYEAAPTASAAFIASGSKVAGFVVLAKFLMLGFGAVAGRGGWGDWQAGWVPLLAVLALFSMLLGNLAALVQRDVKRLLAYSAVAQAGYVLVGLAGNSAWSGPAVIYYAVTYAAAALGAFAILGLVEDEEGRVPLESLAGLSRQVPLMGASLLVFMLSMAGMPPLAGFYGKFTLFAGAVQAASGQGLLWLVIVGVLLSAVSLYYYLLVLKQAFVAAAPESEVMRVPGGVVQVVVGLLALGVVLLGCCPQWLVQPLTEGLRAAGW